MRFVVGEVRVGLDFGRYGFEGGTLFQLHIDHAAMDALAQWDGNGERILDPLLASGAYRVAHRHARTKVGIAQSLRSKRLEEHPDHGV